jgi:uncharacterized protein (DUF58 family)
MSLAARPSVFARWRQRLWRLEPEKRTAVTLTHQRIYILPTKRGLALIVTLTIMLLTSMNYSLSLGYALTFLVAGVIAAALLQTFRNLAGIVAAPLAAGEAFAGSKLEFTLSLSTADTSRHGIVVKPRAGASVWIDLPADATRPIQLCVPTTARGRCTLGRVTIWSDFPLGVWRAWAYLHFPLTGIVYPAPEMPPQPLPAGEEGFDVRSSSRNVDAELAGLRDYHIGDPLNRIAWKAVARGAGWYTKQFEGSGGGGPLELKWAELPAAMEAEARLARLCAWVLEAEREARAFSLSLPGTELPSRSGAGHRRQALAALAIYPERL